MTTSFYSKHQQPIQHQRLHAMYCNVFTQKANLTFVLVQKYLLLPYTQSRVQIKTGNAVKSLTDIPEFVITATVQHQNNS